MRNGLQRILAATIIGALILSAPCIAFATNLIGKVEGFSVEQRDDGRALLFFRIVDQPLVPCATAGYGNFVVDIASVHGRAVYASVLAAHLASRAIGVNGADTCQTDSRAEDVRNVDSYLGR